MFAFESNCLLPAIKVIDASSFVPCLWQWGKVWAAEGLMHAAAMEALPCLKLSIRHTEEGRVGCAPNGPTEDPGLLLLLAHSLSRTFGDQSPTHNKKGATERRKRKDASQEAMWLANAGPPSERTKTVKGISWRTSVKHPLRVRPLPDGTSSDFRLGVRCCSGEMMRGFWYSKKGALFSKE